MNGGGTKQEAQKQLQPKVAAATDTEKKPATLNPQSPRAVLLPHRAHLDGVLAPSTHPYPRRSHTAISPEAKAGHFADARHRGSNKVLRRETVLITSESSDALLQSPPKTYAQLLSLSLSPLDGSMGNSLLKKLNN